MDACYTTQQALTRPRNDPFHQVDDMRITSYASRYYLNRPATNCPTTFPVNVTTRIQASGASWPQGKWKTDVESDLRRINIPNTFAPWRQYQPPQRGDKEIVRDNLKTQLKINIQKDHLPIYQMKAYPAVQAPLPMVNEVCMKPEKY